MIGEPDRSASWEQPVFRYLLGVEMARARRTGRSFLVVVVDGGGRGHARVDREGVHEGWPADVVDALAGCLRETDLVGWHRPGRAAAAVTGARTDGREAHLLMDRVARGLEQAFGRTRAGELAVRVYAYDASGSSATRRLTPPMAGTSARRATRGPEAGRRVEARVGSAAAGPVASR